MDSPAPRIELAILAIESNIPPPAVLLAAISFRSRESSPMTARPFDERGMEESRLRREADESKRPTRRGMDWSPSLLLRGEAVSSPRRVSSSKSSESSSYSGRNECQCTVMIHGTRVMRGHVHTCFATCIRRSEGWCDDLYRVLETNCETSTSTVRVLVQDAVWFKVVVLGCKDGVWIVW